MQAFRPSSPSTKVVLEEQFASFAASRLALQTPLAQAHLVERGVAVRGLGALPSHAERVRAAATPRTAQHQKPDADQKKLSHAPGLLQHHPLEVGQGEPSAQGVCAKSAGDT